eukprot:CAMPEP_0197837900 /NCGR_PEP_ID=MMETSP1437-20131217/33691_1 /TAXON_ID=49252 ORGANISM="Eucampia antarctica, Strain CCMP1452" /NCGR_SAMPLE_ID=MMETSP1437 /ASSEMBLY_ACC=CAM_ASM_001096 /LENGTH=92 /DNA_ID=CAMNT_0043445325 /DNA_START=30 /DNA_END=308 /DNA_ORIENTATION=+
MTIKAIRFEMVDRERCGSLPALETFHSPTSLEMNYMRSQRTKSAKDKDNLKTCSALPFVTVPKLTTDNYETFNISFCASISKIIGMNGISLD